MCGSSDRDLLLQPHFGFSFLFLFFVFFPLSFWGADLSVLCSVHYSFKSLLVFNGVQYPPFHGILTTLLLGKWNFTHWGTEICGPKISLFFSFISLGWFWNPKYDCCGCLLFWFVLFWCGEISIGSKFDTWKCLIIGVGFGNLIIIHHHAYSSSSIHILMVLVSDQVLFYLVGCQGNAAEVSQFWAFNFPHSQLFELWLSNLSPFVSHPAQFFFTHYATKNYVLQQNCSTLLLSSWSLLINVHDF